MGGRVMGALSCSKGMTSDQIRSCLVSVASAGVTRRRHTQVSRRPVVMFAAALAPGILAAGMLAGEFSESQRVQAEWLGPETVDGAFAFESVRVPAPAHADRRYEAAMPARVRIAVGVASVAVTQVRPPDLAAAKPTSALVERRAAEAERPRERERCPSEWEGTWLWELCRAGEGAVSDEPDVDEGVGENGSGSGSGARVLAGLPI